MNYEVFITCAVTGSGDTVGKHPDIPVTPTQIADAAIEAARTGAAIAHIHVRDRRVARPTGPSLYREVVDGVRARAKMSCSISRPAWVATSCLARASSRCAH